MMYHRFEVCGKVRGQGRPRTTRLGKVYKAPEDRDYEGMVKACYINTNGPWFGSKPLKITVETYRKLPKSASKIVASEHDVHKPDASNVLKAVEDALNGIAYADDRQIVDARVIKHDRERWECEKIVVTLVEVV